ncbi:hypothetical protein EDC94DRAFT_586320 [Helicostylum pulchrum]|nr:hypothetical protein EDC94DRAFT_586320 [Helicostylum pulchrum]
MIDHRIVSGAETNTTRTESIRLQILFSLFPTPGLQWRFIKIDGTNINSFARQGNTAEIDYESTLTKFYEAFDFSKFPNLKIKSVQALSTLPDRINKIFINEVKTDGYTSHFTFARRRTENPMVKLELQNFKQDEIDLYFRPRTINPGRNHVFTSFHGDNEIRRMSTTDFYSYGEVKRRAGVSNIESNIPTTKTTSLVKYREHVRYIILYMADLFEFYGFNTSKMRWLNYMAEQKAQDAPVIILINGGKKYNKKRRKRPKTAKNKRQRRNNRNNRLANAPVLPSASAPVTTPFSSSTTVKCLWLFLVMACLTKMAFTLKATRTSIVYKNLRRRKKLGELCLLDINEFRTSVVCNTCKTKSNVRLQPNNKVLCCTNCRKLLWNRDTNVSE